MNDKNPMNVPGSYTLPMDGAIINDSLNLEGYDYAVSREQMPDRPMSYSSDCLSPRRAGAVIPATPTEEMMISSIEHRLQQWLGDDASYRLSSAPPIRRSPMPAANLEPTRLTRFLGVLSPRRLMAICGLTAQACRRILMSSGY